VFGGCGFEEDLCGWVSSTDAEGSDWWIRKTGADAGSSAPQEDFAGSSSGQVLGTGRRDSKKGHAKGKGRGDRQKEKLEGTGRRSG